MLLLYRMQCLLHLVMHVIDCQDNCCYGLETYQHAAGVYCMQKYADVTISSCCLQKEGQQEHASSHPKHFGRLQQLPSREAKKLLI
jgi:hypothetical protein